MVFYGVNNANLRMLRALFSKLRIVGRGSVLKIIGNPEDIAEFDVVYEAIYRHCVNYNKLTEEDIVTLIQGRSNEQLDKEGVIVYSTSGKPILARSQNQQKLVDAYKKDDLLFCIGPAGTGKTFVAVVMAVQALKKGEVKKIILTRPAVEAGENLGFLPGDLKEKVDPYLRPLYDALYTVYGMEHTNRLLERGVIEVAPLAYMRGRTLEDSFIILDEAQNTTRAQMKMFLTRLGFGSKMIVNGDKSQIDLPKGHQASGLLDAERKLKGINGIAFVEFDAGDVVRHPIVSEIINAYSAPTETERERGEESETKAP